MKSGFFDPLSFILIAYNISISQLPGKSNSYLKKILLFREKFYGEKKPQRTAEPSFAVKERKKKGKEKKVEK